MSVILASFFWAGYTVKVVEDTSEGWFLEFYQGKKFVGRFKTDAFFEPTLLKGDLDGDGLPELVVESYTGGAHCCHIYSVFSAKPTLRHLGNVESGSAPLYLEKGQLRGLKLFEYFDDLPFFLSPAVPVAYSVREGRLVERTPQEALESWAGEAEDSLRAAEDEMEALMWAASYYAAMSRLGKASEAIKHLKRVCPSAVPTILENKEILEH